MATPLPFDFHDGFWTNLPHFLLQQSIEPTEGDSFPTAEKTTWADAVHFYQLRSPSKDRLSREMETIKNSIEDHDNARVFLRSPDYYPSELPCGNDLRPKDSDELNRVAPSSRWNRTVDVTGEVQLRCEEP